MEKLNALAVCSNKTRFKVLIALFVSDVMKWGPEFERKKKQTMNKKANLALPFYLILLFLVVLMALLIINNFL